jgi:molybdopterin molybdotransferase
VVRDDPAALEAAFRSAADAADAVITSGGVSVGEADHTKRVMAELGEVLFWKIAMRPGRPMAIGRIGTWRGAEGPTVGDAKQAILFGLPGNPVAVMVTFYAFVRDALLRMSGANPEPLPMLRAASTEPIRKKPGRTEYQRGIVTPTAGGGWQVAITGSQGSGILRSMSQANGLVVLHHGQGNVAVGEGVDVLPFDGLV